MDYTPISARRVLASFGFTFLVAVIPAAIALFATGSADNVMPDSGYRWLAVGSGIAIAVVVIGLLWLAVAVGRKVVRRPFRA
jgi:uncharacterized membrane protein